MWEALYTVLLLGQTKMNTKKTKKELQNDPSAPASYLPPAYPAARYAAPSSDFAMLEDDDAQLPFWDFDGCSSEWSHMIGCHAATMVLQGVPVQRYDKLPELTFWIISLSAEKRVVAGRSLLFFINVS